MNLVSDNIGCGFPGEKLHAQGPCIRKTAVQTLTTDDAKLDFGHVEPGTVNGCEVEAQTVGDAVCFDFTKQLDKRMVMMRVEIVQNNINTFSRWIKLATR